MKENERKLRFNFFDVIIIAAVVLAVAAALLLRNRSQGNDVLSGREDLPPMRYTLELRGAAAAAGDCFEVGGEVWNSATNESLGTLVDMKCEPYVDRSYSEARGEYVEYQVEDLCVLTLVIENGGKIEKGTVTIGTVEARIGAAVYVKRLGFAGTGYIIAVDTMGADNTVEPAVGKGDTTITYLAYCDDVRSYTTDACHVGDVFYSDGGAILGTVTDVSLEPYEMYLFDRDGSVVKKERPERYRMIVTLEARGMASEHDYYLDETQELRIGSWFSVRSQYIQTSFTVADILGAA